MPLAIMAPMLIGVYEGLFASGATLGIADESLAASFRVDMAEPAADGRYYCLTPTLISAWKQVS
ncbi:MAG TPA: hypothetical protein VIG52_06010 [Methyloceanibacter sp.]